MKIWWCQEHRASGFNAGHGKFCHLHPFPGDDDGNAPCRMVPMRLIPDNGATVEREALTKALAYYDRNDGAFVMSHVALYIAAARAWLDGETP